MQLRRFAVIIIFLLRGILLFGATPQVVSTSPVSGSTGSQVQINGSGFGATQGSSTVKFNGSYAAAIVNWSDTMITANVPVQAFTGVIVVTVGGVDSNSTVYFNVPGPLISSISPTSGVIGTQMTVSGSGFQNSRGANSSININGTPATVVTWIDTQIVATVAANTTSGVVSVVVNSIASNQDQTFTLPNPIVSGVAPASGPVGTVVHISGSGFGPSSGSSTVQFNGANAVTTWTDTNITATVPGNATTGQVLVTVGGVATSSNVNFTIPPPQVSSVTPATANTGTFVTVAGSGFQATQGTSSITFNGVAASTINSWSDTQIVAKIPPLATTGPVRVVVNGVPSNLDVLFTVPSPLVTSISPVSGPVGTPVVVTGSGFGTTTGTLQFAGIPASISPGGWTDGQILATVPDAANSGTVQVIVAGITSHSGDVNFTVSPPHVTSVSPGTGGTGAHVTITGTGFRTNQTTPNGGRSDVSFNGANAAVTTWSDTQIAVIVPPSATSGAVAVHGYGANSNKDVVFTMPSPVINSLSPSVAPVLTQVQINGSGFGTTPGTVTFNNIPAASIGSPWQDTQILATVPATATSGIVSVTVGGVPSNANINLTIPPPQITGISPATGIVGTPITITGSGFQGARGSNNASIGTTPLTINATGRTDTQITASIPSGASTNAIKVTVNGIDSNKEFLFTLPNPLISGFTPSGGPAGTTAIQISGSGFGGTQVSGSVAMIGTTNISVSTWTDSLITGSVSAGTATGAVKVTVGGVTATGSNFTVANLFVNAFSPLGGPTNTPVTVTGNGFGSTTGTISFNNVAATTVGPWSDTQIVANVPAGATSGPIKVTVGSASSTSANPFNVGSVIVSGVSPTSGLPTTSVQINGSGFGTSTGTVTFNNTSASIGSWSPTQITATVPNGATSGAVKVTAGGVASNTTVNFVVAAPNITGVSPASGIGTTQVQITGSGFGSNPGSVTFNGIAATQVLPWSDTAITATVPGTARTGPVKVTVGGVSSNTNVWFTVPTPRISSISPTSGVVNTPVTVNGSGFLSALGSVNFNGWPATITSWTDTQIVATVPPSARTGPVKVTANGLDSNVDVAFSMPNPTVTALTPTSGPTGTQVQILGRGFGATQNGSTISFNGKPGENIVWTSDTSISAKVPATAAAGPVTVTVGGVSSNTSVNFSVPAPQVTSITPNQATPNTQVTVTGSNFQSQRGSGSNLWFSGNSATASINSWGDSQIVATVPVGAQLGPVWVTVNAVSSNQDAQFAVINPQITGVLPSSGPVRTQVHINGTGFGATQGSSTVTIGTAATVVSWSDTQIVATVADDASSGSVWVAEAGVSSTNNINFTVLTPRITSISPATGTVGTSVTINGSGFQTAIGGGRVCFNAACTTTFASWSDTQIVVAVPSGSTSGAIWVQANNTNVSNKDLVFSMPNPIVTGLAPASGPTGAQVTINGSGFGATQGSSTVTFNATVNVASVVSWSDTQVVAIVPAGTTSGPVWVSEGGVTSNASVHFNVPAPRIISISPSIGGSGNPVTITGTGFQAAQGSSSHVTFSGGGGTGTIKSWSDTQIVAVVPSQTTTGFLDVSVNSIPSNYVTYTIPNQTISTVSPGAGPVETQVTVTGTAFGATQGTSVLSFNGQPAESILSWTNTQIVGIVPVTAASGPAVVTIGGVNSNTALFTVPAPHLTSISPLGGISGTTVTLNGTGFQAHQRDSTVTFNGLPATVTSWSDTQIVASVPSGAATGLLDITVNAVSNPNNGSNIFEVPNPTIVSVTPPEAPPNGTITITGTGFGVAASPGQLPCWGLATCHVRLNGVDINFTSWSDTTIIAQIPASGASSGTLTIVKYDSNASVPFTVEGTPTIASLTPTVGPVGQSVVISGSGFGATQSTSTVDFSGDLATVSNWSDTQITAVVPPGSETGQVTVSVAGVGGETQTFTINGSVQVTDSLGHVTNYVSTMLGGAWYPTSLRAAGAPVAPSGAR